MGTVYRYDSIYNTLYTKRIAIKRNRKCEFQGQNVPLDKSAFGAVSGIQYNTILYPPPSDIRSLISSKLKFETHFRGNVYNRCIDYREVIVKILYNIIPIKYIKPLFMAKCR